MSMSLFILPTQKISLKHIPFWNNYEQVNTSSVVCHDKNIFQSFELVVQNKNVQKQTVQWEKPRSALVKKGI